MAIITYERGTPNMTYSGKDWKAYRWYKSSDTLIIEHLWAFVDTNRNLPFDQLCELLKTFYKHKTVKSYASLHKDEYNGKPTFEVTTKGVFPKFLITKD